MNKKDFKLKCQAQKDFEERILNDAKNKFFKYIVPLRQMNLALDIDLMFWARNFKFEPTYDRVDFFDSYMCSLDIQIRRATDPYRDMDLRAINGQALISQAGKRIFTYYLRFSQSPQEYIEEFLYTMENYILRVLNDGYDKVLNEK